MNLVQLTPVDLAIAALLVIALAASSRWLRLGVGRDLLVAATRMGLQLTLIGYVLKALFAQAHWYWIALMALVMLLVAGREILARQQRRLRGGWAFFSGTGAVFVSSFAVALIALGVIVRADPWYAPQYAIPILGMLLGNTMNGIALTVDRLSQGVWQQRALIEQRLMLGETGHEAMADLVRDSLRGGLIPTINAMAVAGIVSLPGMMTGQILAGSPPLEAVKYQILIWLLIAAGTGFGMILAVRVTARRLFDDRDRLRMDRFQSAEPVPKTKRPGNRRKESGLITGNTLVVLGLLMALVGAGMHFGSEELYTAAGLVEVRKDWEIWHEEASSDPIYDPYFLVTEFDIMQSDSVLLPVIHSRTNALGEELKPEERFIPAWSKRLGLRDGKLLSEQEAVEYLRCRLKTEYPPGNEGVEIAVTSPRAEEAVMLVDLIAASYIRFRLARQGEALTNAIAVLKAEVTEQDGRIADLRRRLEDLRSELNVPDEVLDGSEPWPVSAARQRLRTLLDELHQTHLELLDRQDQSELQAALTNRNAIEIQVSNRLDDLQRGLRADVSASQARYDDLSNRVEQAKQAVVAEAQGVSRYLELKRELENQQRSRDIMQARVVQEEVRLTVSPARVINPATLIRGPWRRSEPYDDALMLAGLLVSLFGLWLRSRPKHANGAGSPPGRGVR